VAVFDAGDSLAYVYGHADKRDDEGAKGLTLDEARCLAFGLKALSVRAKAKAGPEEKADPKRQPLFRRLHR
jgi:hypothetical protein